MALRRLNIVLKIIVIIAVVVWIIFYVVNYAWHCRSPTPMIYDVDIIRYANATWPQRRIPRVIHQTYRTHEIPAIWNTTVQSVLKKNLNTFEYRRWSHDEMDAFVREREPQFYWNTYVTYPHDMQRIDSFRYVLMFYLGGVYVDMDNGCNRPFRDLLVTLEALDPDSPHLAAFPKRIPFGVESDFIISTPGHPFHRQLISRLHWFNHNFILHFWTMLVSAGPVYVSIQERFFTSTPKAVLRLLDTSVFRPMFIYKQNGFTWIRQDARFLFWFDRYSGHLLWYCKILVFIFVCLALYASCKSKVEIILYHINLYWR